MNSETGIFKILYLKTRRFVNGLAVIWIKMSTNDPEMSMSDVLYKITFTIDKFSSFANIHFKVTCYLQMPLH